MPEVSPTIRPKVERAGHHLDRFEAWLGGELICVSKQPWYAAARELIKRGCDPSVLMRRHPDAKPFPLSWWARWRMEESDRGGLRHREWVEMPSETWQGTSRTGDERA